MYQCQWTLWLSSLHVFWQWVRLWWWWIRQLYQHCQCHNCFLMCDDIYLTLKNFTISNHYCRRLGHIHIGRHTLGWFCDCSGSSRGEAGEPIPPPPLCFSVTIYNDSYALTVQVGSHFCSKTNWYLSYHRTDIKSRASIWRICSSPSSRDVTLQSPWLYTSDTKLYKYMMNIITTKQFSLYFAVSLLQ